MCWLDDGCLVSRFDRQPICMSSVKALLAVDEGCLLSISMMSVGYNDKHGDKS